MSSEQQPIIADLLTRRAASKRTSPRLPAIIGVAGTIVTLLNLTLTGNRELDIGSVELNILAAACLFGSLAFATFPVWYLDTEHMIRGQPRLSAKKKWLVCIGLFLVAQILSPTFSITIQSDDEMQQSTTTWIKRSLLETLDRPFSRHDEIVWAQTPDNAHYVPSSVFCPSYSVHLYPLFGLQRGDNWPGVLESAMSGTNGEAVPPNPDVLKSVLHHCEREGSAILKAGYTKESALMAGNIDLFFSRLKSEEGFARQQVVLEDAQIPPSILKKIEAQMAANPDDTFDYVDSKHSVGADKSKSPAAGAPEVVRRLKPIAIATALGRTKDIELSKMKESE